MIYITGYINDYELRIIILGHLCYYSININAVCCNGPIINVIIHIYDRKLVFVHGVPVING